MSLVNELKVSEFSKTHQRLFPDEDRADIRLLKLHHYTAIFFKNGDDRNLLCSKCGAHTLSESALPV